MMPFGNGILVSFDPDTRRIPNAENQQYLYMMLMRKKTPYSTVELYPNRLGAFSAVHFPPRPPSLILILIGGD